MKPLLLFVGFAAAIAVLFRFRGWHVDHYEPAERRAHFLWCLAIALVAASATVYVAQNAILCPPGYSNANPVENTESRKGGIKLVCRADDGMPADGSVFSGVFAWLGILAWTFAGTSAVWRAFGPKAPPRPLQSTSEPEYVAPTDRKDRRRARNRAKQDAQRRGRRD